MELEKLDRERNLYIRESKRIHNEDNSKWVFCLGRVSWPTSFTYHSSKCLQIGILSLRGAPKNRFWYHHFFLIFCKLPPILVPRSHDPFRSEICGRLVLEPARGLDSWCWLKGSWPLGTSMASPTICLTSHEKCFHILVFSHAFIEFVPHLYFCRFKDHPTLNSRYLLLNLLGKGGFSEVYKVRLVEI